MTKVELIYLLVKWETKLLNDRGQYQYKLECSVLSLVRTELTVVDNLLCFKIIS